MLKRGILEKTKRMWHYQFPPHHSQIFRVDPVSGCSYKVRCFLQLPFKIRSQVLFFDIEKCYSRCYLEVQAETTCFPSTANKDSCETEIQRKGRENAIVNLSATSAHLLFLAQKPARFKRWKHNKMPQGQCKLPEAVRIT